VNLDQLSQMGVEDLRNAANQRLADLAIAGGLDQGSILSEAQFYIDEIERRAGEAERRKQSRIALRDFILELVVIALIGGELYFGITGGNQQLAVLQTLNTSADETAKTMKSLREEQDVALATQQQTLQMISLMNGALQTQLGLNFAPAITLTYDAPNKWILTQNLGKTNVYIWGSKTDGVADMYTEPRIMAPGTGYRAPVEDLLKEQLQKLPKGTTGKVSIDLYLKTADQKKYTSSYLLTLVWKDDSLIVNVQHIGIKPEGW
jgi:hypothetical protein